MVTLALQEAVATLSVEERRELIAYIEHTMDDEIESRGEVTVALLRSRLEEMRRDPTLGLTREEHEGQISALLG